MQTFLLRFGSAIAIVTLSVFAVSRTASGSGQNSTQFGQTLQCQPFQQTVSSEIGPTGVSVSTAVFRVAPRNALTIEEIALRLDATDFIVPTIASVKTTVGTVTSAYYLPVPEVLVNSFRPLTLMERVLLHADSGSEIRFSISVDPRFQNGNNGRAEWSLSGQSCASF